MVLGTYSNLHAANSGPDEEYLNPGGQHRFGDPPPLAAAVDRAASESPKVANASEAKAMDREIGELNVILQYYACLTSCTTISLHLFPTVATVSVRPNVASKDEDSKRQEPVEPKPPNVEKISEKGEDKPEGVKEGKNASETKQLKEREKDLQIREEKADKLVRWKLLLFFSLVYVHEEKKCKDFEHCLNC